MVRGCARRSVARGENFSSAGCRLTFFFLFSSPGGPKTPFPKRPTLDFRAPLFSSSPVVIALSCTVRPCQTPPPNEWSTTGLPRKTEARTSRRIGRVLSNCYRAPGFLPAGVSRFYPFVEVTPPRLRPFALARADCLLPQSHRCHTLERTESDKMASFHGGPSCRPCLRPPPSFCARYTVPLLFCEVPFLTASCISPDYLQQRRTLRYLALRFYHLHCTTPWKPEDCPQVPMHSGNVN